MLDQKREPAGTLYRFDPDHRCHAMLDGFVLPNALSWSPDDRSMYFADTHNQVIWVFDYDLDDGAISNRRVFKDWTHQPGRPDGATVDADGYVWNCMVATGQQVAPGAGRPRGPRDPAASHQPDLPAFGGASLDTLTSPAIRAAADAGKTGAGTAGRRPVRAERGRERPAGTTLPGARRARHHRGPDAATARPIVAAPAAQEED